jgi:hypothetical protein
LRENDDGERFWHGGDQSMRNKVKETPPTSAGADEIAERTS